MNVRWTQIYQESYSAVDLAAVRHLDNEHHKDGVSNFIDNPVVADAYSIVVFRSREFLHAIR